MNPDKAIKPWLEACSHRKEGGKAKAYDYVFPDADTRPEHEYFTYRIMGMVPDNTIPEDKSTRTGNTANKRSVSQWITTVEISLFRSLDGMAELARCCIAARDKNQSFKEIFRAGSCAFMDCVEITNETETQNDKHGLKENLHHRMRVRFYDRLGISFIEQNQVVNDVNLTLGDWDT